MRNDISLVVPRDIPGVIVAGASNEADAVRMLRESAHLPCEAQRAIVHRAHQPCITSAVCTPKGMVVECNLT